MFIYGLFRIIFGGRYIIFWKIFIYLILKIVWKLRFNKLLYLLERVRKCFGLKSWCGLDVKRFDRRIEDLFGRMGFFLI